MSCSLFGFILLFLVIFKGTFSNIDRIELIMPKYAIKGGDVILKCDHSVKQANLHKVEWRKGDEKLYRYIKGRNPPYLHWPISGANINLTNSNQKQIHLTNLTFDAGGSYYCMVSIESPSIFTKDSDTKELLIIDPQKSPPKLTFTKEYYFVGEKLMANCTSAAAKPPAHITWLINDERARDAYTKSYFNGLIYGNGYLEITAPSIKQLTLEVSQLHAGKNGKLKLTCLGTIPGYVNDKSDYADIKSSSVEIEIMEMKIPKVLPQDEQFLLSKAIALFAELNIVIAMGIAAVFLSFI